MFFLGFPTPANVKNITKLMECCSFLHFSSFLLRLAIGTHFRPYWTRFGSGFGSIFEYFWNKKATENLMISDFVFSRFWVDFGLQVGPMSWWDSREIGPRGFQGRLEDVALISCPSWLPLGTLLGRFFHLFVAVWHRLQLILGSISFFSSVSSNLMGCVSAAFFLRPALNDEPKTEYILAWR